MEHDNFLALFNRALLLDRTGDLYGAIRDYTEVINQFPNFWAGLQYRANCYRRLGMTAKAEMDEFRIFKAQNDKHFGIQPRWTKKQRKEVRKKSDIDLDKYAQLVEEDEPNVEHEYASVYRGKVQNRKVDEDMMPMFTLSYRQYDNGLKAYTAFDNEVEQFNNTHRPQHRILISCKPKSLNKAETRVYFTLIDTLSVQIGSSRDLQKDCHLLLQRAVAYAVTQDYDAAINDLTAYLQIDNRSSLAYWHRAVCQAMMYEFTEEHGMESKLKSVNTIDDFNEAIRLNPQNPFILYDRGNYYFVRSQYAQAVDDYTRAIEIDPNIAEAYYNRGLARIHQEQLDEGIADLSKAGELGLYDAYSVIKKYRKK
jgi:tetratricopeptide (TPR) repeat protein